ncbi:hypothetical protein TYRP_021425 [Tyrophagus putrescentiae]|nr:hypothetical protein TYRP_021425 [Tyrophagus putrescentiae]
MPSQGLTVPKARDGDSSRVDKCECRVVPPTFSTRQKPSVQLLVRPSKLVHESVSKSALIRRDVTEDYRCPTMNSVDNVHAVAKAPLSCAPRPERLDRICRLLITRWSTCLHPPTQECPCLCPASKWLVRLDVRAAPAECPNVLEHLRRFEASQWNAIDPDLQLKWNRPLAPGSLRAVTSREMFQIHPVPLRRATKQPVTLYLNRFALPRWVLRCSGTTLYFEHCPEVRKTVESFNSFGRHQCASQE